MRYVLTIVGLLLVVGGLAFVKVSQIQMLIGFGEAMAAAGPPPESVSTTEATAQTWETSLRAVGTVASVEGVQISGEVSGVVDQIRFESGAMVKQGDVLVELDRRVERAQLAAAQVTRDLALKTVKRTRSLGAAGAESQAQLDADESALRQASVQIDVLRAQIARKVIRAPFTGRLGIRAINTGQYLSPGTPITTLEAVDGAYVDFELPQQHQPDVTPGLPVRLSAEGMPQLDGKGTIVAIEPSLDPSTRMLKLRAAFDDPKAQLQPGMFVRVEVVLPDERTVVAAPLTAIVYAPFGDSVFIVEPDPEGATGPEGEPVMVARQQFVRLGERRGDFVALLDGVEAGQPLVTAGAFKLRNNARVAVDNEQQPNAELRPQPGNR
ncbi:MAG: efflux RND transporter periplasmic adaptor subunit [Nannocystaceae bacterium]